MICRVQASNDQRNGEKVDELECFDGKEGKRLAAQTKILRHKTTFHVCVCKRNPHKKSATWEHHHQPTMPPSTLFLHSSHLLTPSTHFSFYKNNQTPINSDFRHFQPLNLNSSIEQILEQFPIPSHQPKHLHPPPNIGPNPLLPMSTPFPVADESQSFPLLPQRQLQLPSLPTKIGLITNSSSTTNTSKSLVTTPSRSPVEASPNKSSALAMATTPFPKPQSKSISSQKSS